MIIPVTLAANGSAASRNQWLKAIHAAPLPIGAYVLCICAQLAFSAQPTPVAPLSAPSSKPADSKATDITRPAETQAKAKRLVERGLRYLTDHGQATNGTFSAEAGPGITALALTAALRNGRTADDPMVSKGLAAMERFVKSDGGIYDNPRLKNYETCVSLLCFSAANAGGKYTELMKRAKAFVSGLQYDDGNGTNRSDVWYGGASYSGDGRPDLSNTSYLIEALRSLDTGTDLEIRRALTFVSRCQNLDSQYNDTEFAGKVNDGGFYYEVPREAVDPAQSPERHTPNGGLRSYGSMTYAGLKSMVYAGLTKDDPRVKAAVEWVSNHYSVESNPGMGTAGLYYYYNTFASSLHAVGASHVQGVEGKSHDWRSDLVGQLEKLQAEDGSWSNANPRWMEKDKNLATSFALLALSYCQE